MTHTVTVGGNGVEEITISNEHPFVLISGPCAIESRDIAMQAAEELVKITQELGIPYIYKSSFDKANRTSAGGKRGTGMDEGLKILQEIRDTFKVPVLTDLHESAQAKPVGEVVDVLQIPAFLCRQTDLLLACGETGKAVNVKKGQFLAPEDMAKVADKIASTGNKNILLTERGTTFGYNNLVVDMRSMPIMKKTGYPVVMDATHSVMMPAAHGDASGGKREFVEPLSRAAAAIGVGAFFMEAHPNPAQAFSDKETQIPIDKMKELLQVVVKIDEISKNTAYRNIPNAA